MTSVPAKSASARQLAENTFWSLTGNLVPVLAAILLVPFLIATLGTERFGLLTLIWAGVGYFSLFDLGISRGLTQRVVVRLARGEGDRIPTLVLTGLLTLAVLGLISAVTLSALSPWLVSQVVSRSPGLHDEARWSLWVLSVSLPFVLLSAGFNGILEGFQRFQTLAYVRIPLGISNFVVPAILATFTTSLVTITWALVASRIAMLIALAILCRPLIAGSCRGGGAKRELYSLLKFGGWLTISNIVGPILTYFDRFFIGALAGLAAVAHYVTPHELISRMAILPQAVMSALFPALSHALASQLPGVTTLVSGASWMMLLAMLPPTLAIALFAEELLAMWLTPEFALQSAGVAQLLAMGVLINTFARIPITALQGGGRADITAKVHLSELLPYLLMLWLLTENYGINGAAVAWVVRALLDCVLLWICAGACFAPLRRIGLYQMALACAVAPAFVFLASIADKGGRGVILTVVGLACLLTMVRKVRVWMNSKE